MQATNKNKGDIGERIACAYLRKIGYLILKRNWYCHWGEIDIIVKKDKTLVFVEVKSVHSNKYCHATDLFSRSKIAKLTRTINIFLCKYNLSNISWRLDLVCVTKDGPKIWLEHYKNVLTT